MIEEVVKSDAQVPEKDQAILTFPIAEHFVSPQGEGEHTGRLMLFIRLAGCSVGRVFKLEEIKPDMGVLHIYQEKCTLYDGRTFACDTNFTKTSRATIEELLDLAINHKVKHVCITGGEPLMHKEVHRLLRRLLEAGFRVHVETSGTVELMPELIEVLINCFVAVAPKYGFLDDYLKNPSIVNEIKLLVDKDFRWRNLPMSIQHKTNKIFLQPVNYEHEINKQNLELCLMLQRQHPHVRVSIQVHKIMGVR